MKTKFNLIVLTIAIISNLNPGKVNAKYQFVSIASYKMHVSYIGMTLSPAVSTSCNSADPVSVSGPKAFIGNYTGQVNLFKSEVENINNTDIKIIDDSRGTNFEVISFTLYATRKGTDPVSIDMINATINKTGKQSDMMKLIFNSAVSGDIIIIENIKAKGPDGKSVNPDPINITVK